MHSNMLWGRQSHRIVEYQHIDSVTQKAGSNQAKIKGYPILHTKALSHPAVKCGTVQDATYAPLLAHAIRSTVI